MKELLTPNEWQHTDPEHGINYPWYVKSFLDVLKTWDLKGKRVFEYGCGGSSLWYGSKGAELFGVESDETWLRSVQEYLSERGIKAFLAHEPDSYLYPSSIYKWQTSYDIVVVDGIERDECVPMALDSLKDGGILIIDNWMQPSVWVANERTQAMLAGLESHVFKQEGHPDWQTAYFIK